MLTRRYGLDRTDNGRQAVPAHGGFGEDFRCTIAQRVVTRGRDHGGAPKSVVLGRASHGVLVAGVDPRWLEFPVCQLRMRESQMRLGRVEAER